MNLRALKSKTLNLKVVPKHTLLHLGIAKKRLAFSLFHIAHVTQFIIWGGGAHAGPFRSKTLFGSVILSPLVRKFIGYSLPFT